MGRRPVQLDKKRPRGTIMPITTGMKVTARKGESVEKMLLRLKELGHRENSLILLSRQQRRQINGVNCTLKKGELKSKQSD